MYTWERVTGIGKLEGAGPLDHRLKYVIESKGPGLDHVNDIQCAVQSAHIKWISTSWEFEVRGPMETSWCTGIEHNRKLHRSRLYGMHGRQATIHTPSMAGILYRLNEFCSPTSKFWVRLNAGGLFKLSIKLFIIPRECFSQWIIYFWRVFYIILLM